MGVRTTADEEIDSAKKNTQEAIKNLVSIVIDKCWGYDDFGVDYRKRINQAFDKLREVDDLLEDF